MLVKRFVGDNAAELMGKIKKELGPDAAILQMRNFKEGGFFGFFGKSRVEITAALEENTFSPKLPTAPPAEELKIKEESHADLAAMYKMLAELKSNIVEPKQAAKFPKPLENWLQFLTERGISEKLATSLIEEVKREVALQDWDQAQMVKKKLKEKITRLCEHTQGIILNKRPMIVALVGPTGVGKTTTIGKLAAGFSIFQKKSIALFTGDTYRVAAVEQLKIFGNIIGDPVEVVSDLDSLKAALHKHQDKEVIFIDTAGRSPNHAEHLAELQDFLALAQPDIIMLVLSVTTNFKDQMIILKKFRKIATHIIFTKLDESSHPGAILDLILEANLPVAYLTNGQSVPEDIVGADGEKLAGYILGEDEKDE